MHYTQLFRNLREAKGLTLEALAKQARCHRNTVINVESGRPVKFKTISRLVQKMGYRADSEDLKSIALLWLEATSGIRFSSPDMVRSATGAINRRQGSVIAAADSLRDTALASHLTPEQIDLLAFAARQPELIGIIGQIRTLGQRLRDNEENELMVAED